jgi:transposase
MLQAHANSDFVSAASECERRLWLRHQPQSALALWFAERVRRNGGRHKKTTIVALARKLLVALWKYVTAGVVIEGAVMKATGR